MKTSKYHENLYSGSMIPSKFPKYPQVPKDKTRTTTIA